MKTTSVSVAVLLWLLLQGTAFRVVAQEKAPGSRFSHKGIKAALGFGSFDMSKDVKLKDGEAVGVSLGYGFSDRVSLWLSLFGAEHPQIPGQQSLTDFGGLELNLQYKFATRSRFQPYGKVGVGGYALQVKDSDVTTTGSGFNLALGADFFFSRHFGIGAEVMFKGIDYNKETRKVNGSEVVSDLPQKLDGDSVGFMVTLTIQ